jgi:hypothetical protein
MHVSTLFLIFLLWLESAHNIHLTYGKGVVDEGDLTIMISFFLDDFELMLSNYHNTPVSGLSHDGDADSLLHPYLREHFVIHGAADTLSFTMIESAIREDMCYYMLFFDTDNSWKELEITNTILFREFTDQKNLLRLESLQNGRNWSFYHVEGADTYTIRR